MDDNSHPVDSSLLLKKRYESRHFLQFKGLCETCPLDGLQSDVTDSIRTEPHWYLAALVGKHIQRHKLVHQAEAHLRNTDNQVIIPKEGKLGKSDNRVKLNIGLLRRATKERKKQASVTQALNGICAS